MEIYKPLQKGAVDICLLSWGGGALVFKVGYHPHKNIHVFRVIFQVMCMHTSFRGAKNIQIWGKGHVF